MSHAISKKPPSIVIWYFAFLIIYRICLITNTLLTYWINHQKGSSSNLFVLSLITQILLVFYCTALLADEWSLYHTNTKKISKIKEKLS